VVCCEILDYEELSHAKSSLLSGLALYCKTKLLQLTKVRVCDFTTVLAGVDVKVTTVLSIGAAAVDRAAITEMNTYVKLTKDCFIVKNR
jgi:hypothetical protein